LRELIAQSSHPSELVLDPFCGSGATGHAARSLSRRALLADVDTAIARRRLRLINRQCGPAQA
jgi:DNA modification methylase